MTSPSSASSPSSSPSLPRGVRLLLRACLSAKDREFLMGDLEEEWRDRTVSIASADRPASRWSARRWLWRQTIGLIWTHGRRPLRHTLTNTLSGGSTMALSISTTDVRYAARAVASRPALTLSLVATLGGGIALATIMFSVLNAVLLVPLPYHRAGTHRLRVGTACQSPQSP